MMRRFLAVCLLICIASACGVELKVPPLALSSRDSLVGAGKVVQIENTSSEPLTEIEVTLRNPAGEERTFVQSQLEGYESFEIGWKKLGGWEIPPGTRIEVKCEGFLSSFVGVVGEVE